MANARRTRRQAAFRFPKAWGGWRKGAGPKPKGECAGVSHHARENFAARFPVHVTLKLKRGLPSLRRPAAHAVLLAAFGAMGERGTDEFRLVQYSVQSNHLHLLCEAHDRSSLSRAIQALAIRIAKRLNRLWRRAGKIFADRYHDRILRTPREVRNALGYVLNNAVRHGVALARGAIDPYSSGCWFDGWMGVAHHRPCRSSPLARARTWLLSAGWSRSGRIELASTPVELGCVRSAARKR